MKHLNLDIITLDRVLYHEKALGVSVPTMDGEITVLPHHIPLITPLMAGEVRIKVEKGKGIYADDEVYVAIGGGFLEVTPDRVTILADSAERVDEIDEQKAMEAKARAEEQLKAMAAKQQVTSDVNLADASSALARELARLKVVKRKKRHHS